MSRAKNNGASKEQRDSSNISAKAQPVEKRKFKDSGIPWIGEMPEGWDLKRLQIGLSEINEKNYPIKTDYVLSLTNTRGVIPYEEKGDIGNKSKDNHEEYKIAYPNTIVANSMNILIGSVGICNYYGCVSPVYYVFKNKDNAVLKYYNYILSSQPFQKYLRQFANGILEIRLRLSTGDILKRIIPVPSFKEQQAIADYLDKKCSEIDELISLQEKIIEELKAYKQSVITEAVTKGLNPVVPMKDSGIEWLGDIPVKWKCFPFKAVYSLGKGLSITKADLVEVGVPVISYGQIHSKKNSGTHITDELIRYVPGLYIKDCPDAIVRRGDVIFADTSEDLEGCGNCVYIDREGVIFAGYHTIIARNLTMMQNKYFSYLFKTDYWRKQLRSVVNGVKLFSIPQKLLSSTSIVVPPVVEQQAIADYLDKKCSEIDSLISLKQDKIEYLKEYKKSIIYEYTTGKKEVVQ